MKRVLSRRPFAFGAPGAKGDIGVTGAPGAKGAGGATSVVVRSLYSGHVVCAAP